MKLLLQLSISSDKINIGIPAYLYPRFCFIQGYVLLLIHKKQRPVDKICLADFLLSEQYIFDVSIVDVISCVYNLWKGYLFPLWK